MSGPFRIAPGLGAAYYQTYQITAPVATHWRPATCEEVDCEPFLNGWKTILPADSDLLPVLKGSGRRYVQTAVDGGLIEFTFEAGQTCFQASQHKVPLERPELYIVRGGDWRGNPRGTAPRQHSGPDSWLNDFGSHQDRLSRLIEG